MPQLPGVKTGPAGPPPKAPKPLPSLKGLTGSVQAGTKAPSLKSFPGPPQRPIEQAAKKPIPKAGRSEKALKQEATSKAFNELSLITRRNLSEGLSPQKAIKQAVAAVTGNVGETPVVGKAPAQRQLEGRERKDLSKQQREDVAKTVQESVLGIPIGPKKSPIEAGLEAQKLARVPRSIGIVAPPGVPGLGRLAGVAGAGIGLQKLSKTIPAAGPRSLVGEAGELAAAPFLGGVAAGKALIKGAEGNKQPAEQLVKGLSQGAVGEALQGHLGKAATLAKKRPLLALAEGAGVTSLGGRLAGASLRAAGSTAEAGGLRGGLARAGSYVRAPVAMTEDAARARGGYLKQREFSKDSTRKLAELAADMRRKPLRDEHGNVVTVHERGRELPVLKGSPKEQVRYQKQRASFEAGTTQAVEHLEREKGRRVAAKIEGVKGRAREWVAPMRVGQALTRLAAGGTIKHIGSAKADVAKYIKRVRNELKRPEAYRDTHELEQAQQHVEMLEKALTNPRINWDSAVQRGIKYGRSLREGDVRLKETSIYEPHELEHGALSEYALAHMKARWGKDALGHESLLGSDGKPLSIQNIEAHAIRNGRAPETLGYVPHAVTAERPGAYHIPLKVGNRPVTPQHPRMGIVWGRGGMQMDTQMLKDELVAKRVKANNAEAVDRVVKSAGVVRPNGQYFTPREAVEAARRMTVDTKTPYVAVRTVPAKLDPQIQKLIKDAQDPAAMETAHHAMLNDRIVTDPNVGNQTANVVLMPTAHVQTLLDHLTSPKDTERLLQMLNGPFRMAVLPQPRWLTGNFVEPYIVRLTLSGAGVNIPGSAVDFAATTKVLRAMEHSGDPRMMRAALETRAMQRGGLFIGQRGASLHRTWQGFSGRDAEALYAAHVVRNLPVTRQMGDLFLSVPHTFFHVNRLIESTAQGIALGKSIRNDVQAITGSWTKSIKLGERAVDEVSKGLVDTATQHRFMEQQYQMLGQYAGFSPSMRRLVQSVFPFIPWTLNSVRFAYWTLPMHHTATFAALTRMANTVQAEWEAEHKNLPPGELRYALKRSDKGLVNLARYTPFAAAIALKEGDYQNFTNMAIPQLQGSAEALKGLNPFGQELRVPKTKANPKGKATKSQKAEIAVNRFLEAVIPLAAMGRRLLEGGGTPYDTSTIFSPKTIPGSNKQGALSRTLNPFAPTYLHPHKGKGGKRKKPNLGPVGASSLGPAGGGGLGPTP